jgi:hypothetical protein
LSQQIVIYETWYEYPQPTRKPEFNISYINNNKWKPITRRPVGRPKSRWEDDVRNDLKKMKLIKWTGQVQDRLKWKDIVEKTKTLPEL